MDDLLKQPLAQALVRLAECPLMTQLGHQSSRQLARSTPSRMMVWPDNLPLLTPGTDMARSSRTGGKRGAATPRKAGAAIRSHAPKKL
jgi:hypothetical protein